MDDITFLEPFERLLKDLSSPRQVRAIEAGEDGHALWSGIAESGFLDALMPEASGGAGLALRDVGLLVEALGRYLTPFPVAETMVARALLAQEGMAMPDGAILLAAMSGDVARNVPLALVARHALIDTGSAIVLQEIDRDALPRPSVHGGLAADIRLADPILTLPRPLQGLRAMQAVLDAAKMAGVAARLLEMTVAYANERVQFGKPIGKQQAIQQQLAIMAEKTVMMRMAARIGTGCAEWPSLAAAATAKSVTSAAAVDVAAIAHAVHGAIGISEEHDLQLYTRRLQEWRVANGSEGYWQRQLGDIRLAHDASSSAAFARAIPPTA
ncbi:acyl-CoA/acyl-ACP dehydrogenase [Sphingomonas sp. CGMCC 1.13654]|uniref:Acyl-CoA/acyl-ACP dehydrogenase n=1 Tax=Sphingomonas chungangi TaxID=2683589 RepID=A0A838L312_9SPHN|nr:acyl-CoA dehydrogenase family protein [Sphingomonas chungangi]MBA2933035.1 acyl-CoA/acyl-ACP dehydrogenase [Sphingomonas chungangi]MVW56655.1 acyl-CoA dehydrogenase [Sphingomonas chungangi]